MPERFLKAARVVFVIALALALLGELAAVALFLTGGADMAARATLAAICALVVALCMYSFLRGRWPG